MAILKRVALVLAVLAILLALIALFLPATVHVERKTQIEAPAATVFTVLNGFRNFNKWSPWYALDPQTRYTHSGPDSGVGAKLSWASDSQSVGSGSQEIIESRKWDWVKTKLDFGAQGAATAFFTLVPRNGLTEVTWGFDTDLGLNPVSRYFGLFFDRMIGPDYEKGLAALKTFVEQLPKADFSGLAVEQVEVVPHSIAYLSASSIKEPKEIAMAIGKAFAEIEKVLQAHKLSHVAPPMTITTRWDDSGYGFDAAIPVDRIPRNPGTAHGSVGFRTTYSGKALRAIHKGPYQNLTASYDQLFAFAAASGIESNGRSWNQYISDPAKTPEAELVTHIYLPVK
ncbi:MAG: GyrI-like domain-containing protein [Acidobacteriota bacterium]